MTSTAAPDDPRFLPTLTKAEQRYLDEAIVAVAAEASGNSDVLLSASVWAWDRAEAGLRAAYGRRKPSIRRPALEAARAWCTVGKVLDALRVEPVEEKDDGPEPSM